MINRDSFQAEPSFSFPQEEELSEIRLEKSLEFDQATKTKALHKLNALKNIQGTDTSLVQYRMEGTHFLVRSFLTSNGY